MAIKKSNTEKNETESSKIQTEFDGDLDQEIIALLQKEGPLQTNIIIEKLLQPIKKKSRKKEYTKHSRPTILHRLARLTEEKRIIRIEPKNFAKYDIQEKRGNTIYYASLEYCRAVEYKDSIFETLRNGTDEQKKMALIELVDMQNVIFSPTQLELLLPIIRESVYKDQELYRNVLQIIMNHIRKGILPLHIDQFEEALIKSYKLIENNDEKDGKLLPNTRMFILHILALVQNKEIINIIKNLAKNNSELFKRRKHEFEKTDFAKIITDNHEELYRLTLELPHEIGIFVMQIKNEAKMRIYTYLKEREALVKTLENREKEQQR